MKKILVWCLAITLLIIAGWAAINRKSAPPQNSVSVSPIPEISSTVVGGDVDSHGCKGSAGYSWCEQKNKCLRVWEEKCEGTVNNDQQEIENALRAKNKWDPSLQMTVTVKDNDGVYASGSVNAKEGGGGYFFAKKVGNEWKIVADGNGMIACETLKDYPDYPKEKIPSCYDPATGEITKR